jgi:O-antigen ligase
LFEILKNREEVNYYLLLGVAVAIPNFPFLLPLLILLLGINWIIQLVQNRPRFNFSRIQLFLLGFYVFNLLGMFFTEQINMQRGWFDLEIKLSILLLPLYFSSFSVHSKNSILKILKIFSISATIAGVWHLVRSIYLYSAGLENYYVFFGDGFTNPLHIGYFALYINVAIFFALYFFQNAESKKHKFLWLLASCLLVFSLFLSSSKAGIISFVVVFILYGFYMIFLSKSSTNKLSFSIAFVVIGVLFSLFFTGNSKTMLRFKTAVSQITETEISPISEGSTQARIYAFKTSIEIISENFWLGVGTGDIDPVTISTYKENRYEGALKRKLNAHNQFLQTFGALGLFGFLSLVLIFVGLWFFGVTQKNELIIFFTTLCFLFALTESFLETQAGIVFFSFFSLILTSQKK